MTSTGPPRGWQSPTPSVTQIVWPSGWVCQAVRAPGVKWTLAACRRDGAGAGGYLVDVDRPGKPIAGTDSGVELVTSDLHQRGTSVSVVERCSPSMMLE